MSTLAWIVLSSVVTALVCLLVIMFTRARGTPYLELDPDEYPEIKDALPLIAGLTESAVHEGNSATVLQNGALFPAMLADIAAAKHSVHLETFVWSAGKLETQFVDALSARARAGVKVRVLIDCIGASKASEAELERLRQSGAKLASYCKPHWWNLGRFNHRTHRKLLVVDGRIGYTFGHGIADQWLGNGNGPRALARHGRASRGARRARVAVGVRAELGRGDALPAGRGRMLSGARALGRHLRRTSSAARRKTRCRRWRCSTRVAIAMARREVLIQNPYFAPNDGVVELFAMMVRRGVKVSFDAARASTPTARSCGARAATSTPRCSKPACGSTSSSRRCCTRRSSSWTKSGRTSAPPTSTRARSR